MTRMSAAAALLVVTVLAGCSAAPEPLPDIEVPETTEALANTEAAPEEAPPPEPPRRELPERHDEALAWVESLDGAFVGGTGVAVDGEHYVVHAACEGVEQMRYVLIVDGEELTSAEWGCGVDVVNAAFEGDGQQVEIHLGDLGPDVAGTGFAEVLPASAVGATSD